ncbi:MAG TPA: sphingosine kinase, partial [Galbitalea sp.]
MTAIRADDTAKTAVVIYNPIKVQLDALRAVVAREAREAGWGESTWIATTEDDPGQGAAREAIAAGA